MAAITGAFAAGRSDTQKWGLLAWWGCPSLSLCCGSSLKPISTVGKPNFVPLRIRGWVQLCSHSGKERRRLGVRWTQQGEQQQSWLCHQGSGTGTGQLAMLGFAQHQDQSCPKPSIRCQSHPRARQASLSGCQAGSPRLCCGYLECCSKPSSLTCPMFSCSSLCNFKYPSLEHWVSEMYKPQLNSQYRLLSRGVAHQQAQNQPSDSIGPAFSQTIFFP